MATDFTIIMRVRQAFGDRGQDGNENPAEPSAPFVGASKRYTFVCDNVDRSKEAVLNFQSLGVSHRKNIIKVNGLRIPGGIPTSLEYFFVDPLLPSAPRQVWKSSTQIVPSNILLRENNVLTIESRDFEGETNGRLDNFVIDNVVLFYKTRGSNVFKPPRI